jgi:phthiocerol/phenolphthiocerol synthesis type-I polyketide synthase E
MTVAVVAMAGRYPGARDLTELWGLLVAGADATTFADGAGRHQHSRRGGFLPGLDEFDAALFGMTPDSALHAGPQARVFLEVAWQAAEAGGSIGRRRGGVWVGCAASAESAPDVAALVSGVLDWTGPSLTVSTACSSALVAVHLAARALAAGDCDVAIAGGVRAGLDLAAFGRLEAAGMLSRSGRCRPFAPDGDGYAPGEGAGAIVLQRLDDAHAAGNPVLALIAGSAVGHVGRSGSAGGAMDAQHRAVAAALRDAGDEGRPVSYIEAHAIGDQIADAVELAALGRALGAGGDQHMRCLVGSIKPQIGHLEAASGIAGLHKVLLALQHEQVPATVGLDRVDPGLELESTPFALNDRLRPWEAAGRPRRACVVAHGEPGVQACVVVDEAQPPDVVPPPQRPPVRVLTLRAASEPALQALTISATTLLGQSDCDVDALCFSSNVGRGSLPHRRSASGHDRLALLAALRLAQATAPPAVARPPSPVAVALTGSENWWASALPALARAYPDVAAALAAGGADPAPAGAQIVLAGQFAVVRALASWGVKPGIVTGQGTGRITAACVAGAVGFDAALRWLAGTGERPTVREPRLPLLVSWSGERLDAASLRAALGPLPQAALGPLPAGDLPEFTAGVLLWVGPRPGAQPDPADASALAAQLAAAWQAGLEVQWAEFHGRGRRVTLPGYPFDRAPLTTRHGGDAQDLENLILRMVSEVSPALVPADASEPFLQAGLDSVALAEAAHALARELGVALPVTVLMEHGSARSAAAHLALDRGVTAPRSTRAAWPAPAPTNGPAVEAAVQELSRALSGLEQRCGDLERSQSSTAGRTGLEGGSA